MAVKYYIILGATIALMLSSTRNFQQSDYMSHYERLMIDVSDDLQRCNSLAESQNISLSELQKATYQARMSMKRADFWLRYLEPLAYKKINGPLPVEWEVEVFEKWERPYKRIGAGLTLAEAYLEENPNGDSLSWYFVQAINGLGIFLDDSLTSSIEDYDHFWYANRLHLLNLAAIYTTGFECANTDRILPELDAMMESTLEIYRTYNLTYMDRPLSVQFIRLYEDALVFVKMTKSYDEFDHFSFIRDYVNPLYTINQEQIRKYNPISSSFNDYSLSNEAISIFDKRLYETQLDPGLYKGLTRQEDQRLIDLGEMLFHDPILSGNNERSCASCHLSTEGFSLSKLTTPKHFDRQNSLDRNAPTLHHAYSNHLLTLDGRQINAIEQIREVVNNPEEMACSDAQVIEKLMNEKFYKKELKYLNKFTRNKDIKAENVYAAIARYIASIEQYNSSFDKAMKSDDYIDETMISGFNLFMGKAQCATCHFVPVFNGVKPPYVSSEFEVIGVPEDTFYTALSDDFGRGKVHPVDEMQNAFRTPTIRNISKTAPYMHNGVFASLDQVLEFYNNGGGIGHGLSVENQSLAADSLNLSEREISQIIYFMNALEEAVEFPSAEEIQLADERVLGSRTFGGTY